jgi:hypothetical protein
LIQLIFAWKHGVSIDELAKDTTDSPDVDFFGIIGPDKQFWRSVPSRCNIIGELFLALASFYISRKAEIANFQLFSITNEQILQLDVSMHDI